MQSLIEKRYQETPIPKDIGQMLSMMTLAKEIDECSATLKRLEDTIDKCKSKGCTNHLSEAVTSIAVRQMHLKRRMGTLIEQDLPSIGSSSKRKAPSTDIKKKPSNPNNSKNWLCKACGRRGHGARSLICPKRRMAAAINSPAPMLKKKPYIPIDPTDIRNWICKACGQKGHTDRSTKCPKRAVAPPKPPARSAKRKADDIMLEEARVMQSEKSFRRAEARPSAYTTERTDYRQAAASSAEQSR